MKTRFHQSCQKRFSHAGSALVAVFFMIAVLGMVMYAGARSLNEDSEAARTTRSRVLAKRYAQAGLEIGRHPQIDERDPLLHFSAPDGGGFAVTIQSEEARLNLNALALSPDKTLLRRLFQRWGMKPEQASRLIDCLSDWVDADDRTSLNGAEKRDYQRLGFEGMPFNRPFIDLDEALQVIGMSELDAVYPGWREWFTVHGKGKVEVNDARPELISLLADVPIERVAAVTTFRAGQDGALKTDDDQRLRSAAELAQLLGVYRPEVVTFLTQWTQFEGPIRRIESVGTMGDISRKFVLITENHRSLWRGELPTYGTGP